MNIINFLKRGLCFGLTVQLSAMPVTAGQNSQLIGAAVELIEQRYQRVYEAMPQELVTEIALSKKQELNAVLADEISTLESGIQSSEDIRKKVMQVSKIALEEQKRDVLRHLETLRTDEMDVLAQVLATNPAYLDEWMQYQASFTRIEKNRALSSAVLKDIDHVFSAQLKRSRMMGRQAWVDDLKKVKSVYDAKGDGWKKVLQISALAVAGIGLVTWGIAHGVYSGRFNAARNERIREYNALWNDLEGKYLQLESDLNASEVDYLQRNGFTWGVCGSFEMPDSILCNRYDYALFSGQKHCTVHCYKNARTGQETLHAAPSCISPFIPSDCYDPTEYDRGFNDGYEEGWYTGYEEGTVEGEYDGFYDGYDDGYEDAYYDGWTEGEAEGYASGYADGFSAGYSAYVSAVSSTSSTGSLTLSSSTSSSSLSTYQKGFMAGQQDSKMLFGGLQ